MVGKLLTESHRLNVFIQNSYFEALTLDVMEFGGVAFGR